MLAGACADPPASDRNAEATDADAPKEVAEDDSDDGAALAADTRDPVVLFFGNSLTAGFGVPESRAFPALVQEKIDAAGLGYRVVSAGVSGETSAGGVRRIDWALSGHDVAVFVLELGGNDALRGLDPDALKQNLQAIIDAVKAKHPDAEIVLAGMLAPPNLGPRYTDRFAEVYTELAAENDAALIPFLLQDVAGVPALNLPDRIHPTERGHEIVAETVWETLRPVLREARAAA